MSDSSQASPLTVAEIHGRGRAVVASQPIKPGQIILRESPILLYPNAAAAVSFASPSTSRVSFCAQCFRKIDPLLLLHPQSLLSCPSCARHALLCSPACRSVALASSHSPWVCQTLARLRSSPPLHPDLHTQANFLIAACNLSILSPANFRRLLSLQGDATPTVETATLHSLLSSLSPNFASFPLELTAALLAKDKVNAFGLMEPIVVGGERSVRAYGIFPVASFFNHDCLPNACRFDYVDGTGDRNTDIIVRAIHDIQQGMEVCLSYFPVNWNYKERQQRLLEDYGFLCECDRCKVEKNWKDEEDEEDAEEEAMDGKDVDEDMDDTMEGDTDFPHAYFFVRYLCDREDCGGTLAPLPPSNGAVSTVMECNVCGGMRKEEDIAGGDGEDEGMSLS